MEIKHIRDGNSETLELTGRLDAYWADHLQDELDKCIRSGVYQIRLDMAGVSYISSAGVRVLLLIYRQTQEINGDFYLVNISESVKSVLKLSGIEKLLKTEEHDKSAQLEDSEIAEHLEFGSTVFETYQRDSSKKLSCEIVGAADLLQDPKAGVSVNQIIVNEDCYTIGIGAFGNGFDECRDKFGEFIGISGAVSFLPTDGSNKPDFQIASGSYLPRVNALNAITCRGETGYMCRFETERGSGNITVSEIIDTSFKLTGAEELGLAIVGETAGLVGANLIRSPALLNPEEGIFSFPEIQDCISFTSEKSFNGALIACFGIASRLGENSSLRRYMRNYGNENTLAHIHSSVFSYQPLMKGKLDLKEVIYSLYEKQSLISVVHLLRDDRQIIGVGDTELVRGALWIAPLETVNK